MDYNEDPTAILKAAGKKIVIYLPVAAAVLFAYNGLKELGMDGGYAFLLTLVHLSLSFTLTWLVPRFLTAREYGYKNLPWFIAFLGVCICGFDGVLVHNGLEHGVNYSGDIQIGWFLGIVLWMGSFALSGYNTFADWAFTSTLKDLTPPTVIEEKPAEPVYFTFTDMAVIEPGAARKEVTESELEAALREATDHLRKRA